MESQLSDVVFGGERLAHVVPTCMYIIMCVCMYNKRATEVDIIIPKKANHSAMPIATQSYYYYYNLHSV